jgi:hypothetical protein
MGNPQTVDLDNLKNMGYEGKFFFGNPSQSMQVIFDTGSAWAWLFSEECKVNNCPAKNQKYFQSKSSEFKENQKAGQALAYGKGKIMGHPATDRACFTPDSEHCLHNFSFLTVVQSADLSALRGSGLIGLAPTPSESAEHSDPLNNGVPGFVAQLKQSSEYKKSFDPMFSIYLTNDEVSPGKMTFGGFDLQYAKKGATPKDISWADQSANEAYWAVNGKDIQFGDQPLVKHNQQFILDNGMSLAMAPKSSFLAMVKSLFKDYGVLC